MSADPQGSEIRRITNGAFALEVNAATGRIVSYGPVNGPNVLWNNERARETDVPFPGWLNWGGDKVWIWPEGDWKKWTPERKHPPGDPATAAYAVEGHGRELRIISPIISGYGLRVVRDITLGAAGSRVTIVNRLKKVEAGTLDIPVAVWVVTQTPAPKQIFARLLADAPEPGYEGFAESPWKDVKVEGRIATLERPERPWVKIGLEADRLAVPVGNLLFRAETPVAANAAGPYEPMRRAQVFSDPDDSIFRLPGTPQYVEMEFTSALKKIAVGEELSLTVVWELFDLEKAGAAEWMNGR